MKHEGVGFPCDKYEYSTAGTSKNKKQSKCKGVKYPYDQYEYFASNKIDLIDIIANIQEQRCAAELPLWDLLREWRNLKYEPKAEPGVYILL